MNLPTKITIARLILIPFFVALYMIEFSYHTLVATAVFIIASLTDWLDGYLARKNNQVTTLGKFLDPIADKVLVASALILVAVIENEFQVFVTIASIIIIARELIISCFRMIVATNNVILAADNLGKLKTVTQLIGLSFYLCYPAMTRFNEIFGLVCKYVGFIFLVIATLLTVISAIHYLVTNKDALKNKD
ncbi:MAG: CDP-diacylglycerol--glycerol-3-phosphate 3-phosphatidyltransferase [Clostridia bacterium]|nr:CDP-diacylglycerol--glycerol-3-phosphate 3-phosphatidyltransferase [Clostridia bacterium]